MDDDRRGAPSESRLEQIRCLTQVGMALSAEKRIDKLLSLIIDEARRLTRADGGTLYILSEDRTELRFAIIQNDTLGVRMGGSDGPITWPPVPLHLPDGTANRSHVSAYAALTGEVVDIADVYDAQGFDFDGTRHYDVQSGYRSRSMLVVPMRNHENEIIGVVQLLNAMDKSKREVRPFSAENRMMAESLASQAAVALSKSRLILDLEALLQSFIRTIAMAVDEKSPYTGGHVRRVATLTMAIAGKINARQDGPFASTHLSEDELEELRYAAWLHDVGKITTPEYVVDKASKLQTIFDRMELLRLRAELVRRDREIERLREALGADRPLPSAVHAGDDLSDDMAFLESVNRGDAFLSNEQLARLKEIGRLRVEIDGCPGPFITAEEMENLSIRAGTLNEREREVINDHARMTGKMLSQLPFPRKLAHVAAYAAAHHEKLDGTGYPAGLTRSELPLQARILALADIFEALTASDRPYKKAHTPEAAVAILRDMVSNQAIDADLFELFVEEKIYADCATRELLSNRDGAV